MFGPNNIHPEPLIEKRTYLVDKPIIFPYGFHKSCSEWLTSSIEKDSIDSIVAARFYPIQDLCVFKILYKGSMECSSIYIENITLTLLKRLWDQKNGKLNNGIRYYVLNSPNALYQYQNNRTIHDLESLLWYKKVAE